MTIEKMTQRAQQAVRTRKKIFDISVELIREHGFDGVTIENISKKAGVSVGAFYHYFESKTQVIFEIMNSIDAYFEKEVKGQLSGTSLEKIAAFFGFYADYVLEKDLVYIKHLYTTENKHFIKKDRYLLICLVELIQEGQQNGEFSRAVDAEEIARALFTLERGIVFDWCLHDGSYSLKVTTVELIKRLLSSYKA